MAKAVFFSFHFKRDVHRVQLVRQINALEGQTMMNPQDWEKLKSPGPRAVENWIDDQMKWKRAVIVLVGRETAGREWVQYEINKAWKDKKPLLGVRINGLSSMGTYDSPGLNPFTRAGIPEGRVPIFDPTVKFPNGSVDTKATYNNLKNYLGTWSDQGVVRQW
jgi:hypothetical protein